MNTLIICTLFVLCVFFMVLEIFLIPGTSVAGIAAGICLVVANVMAFNIYGITIGFLILAASLILCLCLGFWMLRSKTLDRISLKNAISSTSAPEEQLSVNIGDRGVALTRLALIGNADFNGKVVQVQSSEGFLDEDTPVVVIRIKDAQVWVKRDSKN